MMSQPRSCHPVSDRLQRDGYGDQAAVHDHHRLRPEHREIKWQVPNGDDPATVDHFKKGDGPRDTGGVGARNGMVVTRTGLLFQNGKDGWARAYDVDTGKVLWKGKTAGQSIGIPTMYEHKGRQYVVFMSPAAGPGQVGGAEGGGTGSAPAEPTGPHGYIAFALPKK